jgi:hypothetical protein
MFGCLQQFCFSHCGKAAAVGTVKGIASRTKRGFWRCTADVDVQSDYRSRFTAPWWSTLKYLQTWICHSHFTGLIPLLVYLSVFNVFVPVCQKSLTKYMVLERAGSPNIP